MEQERCPHVHPKLNLRKASFNTKQEALDWCKANGQTNNKVYRCRYSDCRKWHLYTGNLHLKPVPVVNVRTDRILAEHLKQSVLTEEQANLLQEKFGESAG